ncbi:transcriptional regulator GcvA [Reyranella soli]|uniref:Transcriptional regulator GcvA n=1 Tax=Reyranella soli TaxID=1230389 RepID=A0A512N5E3_9HYPH|nr:transcriptional regulator GcvA [Reyranella soli]GEP54212.1 transcriptional regulator GcvA [Reyranella soli]
MAYRLPPLNSLRLFEAAGRHLSFKAAADELNLTPSAISHGVLTLEAWLGVDLFLRGNRALTLTAAGAAYLPQVRSALEMIVGATNAVPGRKPTGRLAVSVSPTFGVRWLLPRLVRFSDRYPDIEVSVDTSHRLVEFPRDGVDVAIRMGRGDWPGLDACCLVRETLVPVCAPRLAAQIKSADDLGGKVLLHVVDAREDWAAWSKLADVELPPPVRGPRFDTIQMALEAAAAGLGIAMGRLPLVEAELAAGQLVAVLGPPRLCATGYWLVTEGQSRTRPEVTAFRKWISRELCDAPDLSGGPVPRRGQLARMSRMSA